MQLFYKIATLLLIAYSLVAGLLAPVPRLPILNESIRMLYVHVPLWFGMIALYSVSLYYAIRHLSSNKPEQDHLSYSCAQLGFCYGVMGMITGMLWAKYTWGAAWSNDPKQNAAALSMLIYLAYFILRKSVPDPERGARVASVYNILGYFIMLPLIFVLPRLTDSLHPGSGGNPGFNTYDLDSGMRMVFYPSVIGWIMLGIWLSRLEAKLIGLKHKLRQRSIIST